MQTAVGPRRSGWTLAPGAVNPGHAGHGSGDWARTTTCKLPHSAGCRNTTVDAQGAILTLLYLKISQERTGPAPLQRTSQVGVAVRRSVRASRSALRVCYAYVPLSLRQNFLRGWLSLPPWQRRYCTSPPAPWRTRRARRSARRGARPGACRAAPVGAPPRARGASGGRRRAGSGAQRLPHKPHHERGAGGAGGGAVAATPTAVGSSSGRTGVRSGAAGARPRPRGEQPENRNVAHTSWSRQRFGACKNQNKTQSTHSYSPTPPPPTTAALICSSSTPHTAARSSPSSPTRARARPTGRQCG